MKVIDLLNKIANGEKVPKRIRVDRINYIFDEIERFYHRDNESKEDLLALGEDYSTWDFLNWNVEVIEDQTIDIDSIEELNIDRLHVNGFATVKIAEKLNETIRAVKHLNKEIQSIKEK